VIMPGIRDRLSNRKALVPQIEEAAITESNSVTPDDPFDVYGAPMTFQNADGHTVTGIDLLWTAPDSGSNPYVGRYLVQLSRDGGLTWADIGYTTQTNYRIAPLPVTDDMGATISYKARIITENNQHGGGGQSAGAETDVITLTGDAVGPAKPTGLVAYPIPRGIAVDLDRPPEVDWECTVIYVSDKPGFEPPEAEE
jgi:hypothetical protein